MNIAGLWSICKMALVVFVSGSDGSEGFSMYAFLRVHHLNVAFIVCHLGPARASADANSAPYRLTIDNHKPLLADMNQQQ